MDVGFLFTIVLVAFSCLSAVVALFHQSDNTRLRFLVCAVLGSAGAMLGLGVALPALLSVACWAGALLACLWLLCPKQTRAKPSSRAKLSYWMSFLAILLCWGTLSLGSGIRELPKVSVLSKPHHPLAAMRSSQKLGGKKRQGLEVADATVIWARLSSQRSFWWLCVLTVMLLSVLAFAILLFIMRGAWPTPQEPTTTAEVSS